MTIAHLAIVMPAYNEAEGIGGFIDEIRDAVVPLADRVSFHIADDRSTDATATVFDGIDDVTVEVQPTNRGHGPTALAAYRAGLAAEPDVLVHVDGDGQFYGRDFPRLISALLHANADVVHGVRDGRTDPWYRKVLTGAVGVLVAAAAGRRVPDVNTPLRAYRPEALQALIDAIPADASVPHVHFSLAEARGGFIVRYLRVASIPRRGSSTTGTMWGRGAGVTLPPKRLRQFVRAAWGEAWSLSLRPSAPLRDIRRPEAVVR
ncbi:glycosyltransferase family 2 protein [Microbacterium sp. SSW1-49]|uniref:Glycosyltransferase family 2 protein n=1 Tax=Microbacterium croceum TaxID=2851645 RepID=A0ABT0FCV9_9MICO|nr:glycosyltransferase family 2 protein [Microbacterium croceum]MCK2035902.1 glycosyltransferase family 2 protein [Microbacterium croceum]